MHVPAGSVKKYQEADVWSAFHIIGADPGGEVPTGAEGIVSDSQTPQPAVKCVSDGILRIRRDGRTYDPLGRRLD